MDSLMQFSLHCQTGTFHASKENRRGILAWDGCQTPNSSGFYTCTHFLLAPIPKTLKKLHSSSSSSFFFLLLIILLSSSEMKRSWEDLPEECWEKIIDRIKSTHDPHLETISLVCKRFLSISNRLLSTLNVSNRTVVLAPDDGDISPLLRRFNRLERINFSFCLSTDDVRNIIKQISQSDLKKLTALDLSRQVRFPYFAMSYLRPEMKAAMRTLICSHMTSLGLHDLRQIAVSFPNLEELDISYQSVACHLESVTDDGISVIAEKLQKLRSINISGNRLISDVSLIELSSRCLSLSEISAKWCSLLTISGINYVMQHCNNLCSLSIFGHFFHPDFIKSVRSNAINLQCLVFAGVFVSDEVLCVIGEHNLVLRKFVLYYSLGFTYDGLSAVVLGQQSLQHLGLDAAYFLTDEMMSSLSEHLPHVVSINLNGCSHLTSSTFFNLAKNCPSLEDIRMDLTSLGLGGEDLVSELRRKTCKIRSLKLRCNEKLRDETLERIGTLCPELRSLDVSYCSGITEVGIGGIGKYCTKITELIIDGCREVRNLGSDLQFSELEVLMASASGIADEGLEMIGRGCQRLQMVDLEHCRGVTEKGIRELLKSCKVLRNLNVNDCCVDLSADFFPWMKSSSPSLRTILLSSGPVQYLPRS